MILEKEFNEKFLSVLNECLPKKTEQLLLLTQNLSVGREAAYRRLKGDVSFSFSEACIIAREVGISLDSIAKNERGLSPEFKLLINVPVLETYNYEKLHEHNYLFEKILKDSDCKIQLVCNMLPYCFFFPFENLSKIRFFKWRYQVENDLDKVRFSDIILPDEVIKLQRRLGKKLSFLPENIFIFDRDIFSSFVNELRYFYNLELITKEEKTVLKKELLAILSDLENIAIKGRNRGGNRSLVCFYRMLISM